MGIRTSEPVLQQGCSGFTPMRPRTHANDRAEAKRPIRCSKMSCPTRRALVTARGSSPKSSMTAETSAPHGSSSLIGQTWSTMSAPCRGVKVPIQGLKRDRIALRLVTSRGKGRKSVAMRVDTRLRVSTKMRQLQESVSNQPCFARFLIEPHECIINAGWPRLPHSSPRGDVFRWAGVGRVVEQ
jgi:hypothetical protein